MKILKRLSPVTILIGPVVNNSGMIFTGMVISDFNITANGVSVALMLPSEVIYSHNGHYLLSLTSDNVKMAGGLSISCNKPGYFMPISHYEVILPAVYNAFTKYDIGVIGGFLAYGEGAGQISPSSGGLLIKQIVIDVK